MSSIVSTRLLKGSSAYSTRTMNNTNISTDIEQLRADILSHGSKIQINTDNINYVNAAVNENGVMIDRHESRLDNIEDLLQIEGSGTLVDAIQSNMSTLTQNITAVSNRVDEHDSKFETVNDQITELKLDQQDLRTEIGENVGARIDELESNQSALLEEVETNINNRIDGLEEEQSKLNDFKLFNLIDELEEAIFDTSKYEVNSEKYNLTVMMKNNLPQLQEINPKNIYEYHLLRCSNIDRIRDAIDYFKNYPTPEDGLMVVWCFMYLAILTQYYQNKEFHELIDESKECPYEFLLKSIETGKINFGQVPADVIQGLISTLETEVQKLVNQSAEMIANPKPSKHEQIIKNRDDIATLKTTVEPLAAIVSACETTVNEMMNEVEPLPAIVRACETTVNEMMNEVGFLKNVDVKRRCENIELFDEIVDALFYYGYRGLDPNIPNYAALKEFERSFSSNTSYTVECILTQWKNVVLTYERTCSQTETMQTLLADIESKYVNRYDVNYIVIYTRIKFISWLNQWANYIPYTDHERNNYSTCPFAEWLTAIRSALDEAPEALEGKDVLDVLKETENDYYYYINENSKRVMQTQGIEMKAIKSTSKTHANQIATLQTDLAAALERITALETRIAELTS
ncbi:hypothetical protein [Methanobrevibacter sp.]